MKIFINKSGENWICDRLRREFITAHPEISTLNIHEADVVWIIAPWTFRNYGAIRNKKKVLMTVHHVVPEKKGKTKRTFNHDELIDMYHTPSQKSKDQILTFTDKNIVASPWWINNNIWSPLSKEKCRDQLGLAKDEFIIGSFQRDTEGSDLKTPKLEKGPDRFCDIIEEIYKTNKNLRVLLGGWRRQYIINRLNQAGIPHTYINMPPLETLNVMYNSLDLYVVASRHEGGPQAIAECSATKTPIISTDVGCADYYLNKHCIFNFPNFSNAFAVAQQQVDENYNNCIHKTIPEGFSDFLNILS